MKIGEKIKTMRIAAGFNQSLIAQYLNVDQSLVSKIESGERTVSTDVIKKIADLFGCQVSDFFDDESTPTGLKVAFRASKLNCDDLQSIAAVNRIALNLESMENILGDKL